MCHTWITNPGVEDPPCLLDSKLWLEIKASSEHFLAESHNVWRCSEVEMLMGPHFARWTTSSLNFIHDVANVMLLSNVLKTLKI